MTPEGFAQAKKSEKPCQYDIFLSHYNEDKAHVEKIAVWLRKHGIAVWFDKWALIPGLPWQEALETGLQQSHCIAAFLGPSGSFGKWGNMEMRTAIRFAVQDAKPVFMVMLPGCPADPKPPPFLEEFTWIDLREQSQLQENITRLRTAILYHREQARKSPENTVRHAPQSISSEQIDVQVQHDELQILQRHYQQLQRRLQTVNENIRSLYEDYDNVRSNREKLRLKREIEPEEAKRDAIQDRIRSIRSRIQTIKDVKDENSSRSS